MHILVSFAAVLTRLLVFNREAHAFISSIKVAMETDGFAIYDALMLLKNQVSFFCIMQVL